jgi:hypothetical protein
MTNKKFKILYFAQNYNLLVSIGIEAGKSFCLLHSTFNPFRIFSGIEFKPILKFRGIKKIIPAILLLHFRYLFKYRNKYPGNP